MPKKIHGKPVDEAKWEKAKEAAAREGRGDDYAYVMGVYKRMAGISKARLVIFLETLRKGAPLPIGTRKIHGFGTKHAQWVRKDANGKWVYDGMVTPADVKAYEDEQARKKRLGKMKDNMEKKKKEEEEKRKSGQASPVSSDRPSDAELDKAPKKHQLYWREASDDARDLCDITGVLCLNKEAEEYVSKNLDNIFKMTKEQQTEFGKIAPDIPMGSDGKWLEDPLFLEEVQAKMEEFLAEAKTAAYKKRVTEYVQKNWYGYNQGAIDAAVDREVEESQVVAQRWINLLKAQENDKRLLEKLGELDYSLRGTQSLDRLPGALVSTIIPGAELLAVTERWRDVYKDLPSKVQEFFTVLGIDDVVYNSHQHWDSETYTSFVMGALHPDYGEKVIKPWLEKYGKVANTGWSGSSYSGPVKQYSYDDLKAAGESLRKKYPAISAFLQKYVVVPDSAYSVDSWLQSRDYVELGAVARGNGVSKKVHLNPEATWRDIANDLKSMMRAKTVKWNNGINVSYPNTGGYVGKGMEYFDSIIDAGRTLGKYPINEKSTMQAVKNLFTPYRDAMSLEMYSLVDLDNGLERICTGAVRDSDRRYSNSVVNFDVRFKDYGDAMPGSMGLVKYYMGKKMSTAVRPSTRRWRSSSKGYGGWKKDRSGTAIEFGKTDESVRKNLLRGKFHTTVASVSEYHRYNAQYVQGVAAASLMYAVGANWNVRSLAKKSRVIPEWSWGRLKPHAPNNPVKKDQLMLGSDAYHTAIKGIRTEQLAISMGMKTKGNRTMPTIVLKGKGDSGKKEWMDKIKADWSHQSSGYSSDRLQVNAVMEVMYHDYYGDYKAIENAKDNQQYLYHGTDFQAGASIIKGGMRVGSAKNGRLLGDGIYFAKSSSKSAQYVAGTFSRSGSGVMLQCRTSMGKVSPGDHVRERDDSQWDTIYGKKGMSMSYTGVGNPLQHDEWCVRNPKAIVPVAWVDVSFK